MMDKKMFLFYLLPFTIYLLPIKNGETGDVIRIHQAVSVPAPNQFRFFLSLLL